MTVPYAFGAATSAIPLSQLDSNFNTPITLGNTAIQLGNTVTTLNNMTLANVTISSGNVTITNVTVTTANATTVNTTTLIATTGNVTTVNATDVNVATSVTLNAGTANGVVYLNGSKVLTTGSALTFDGTTFQYTGAANFATSSGNVGIGTSSPSGIGKALNVYGSAGNVSTVVAEGDGGNKFIGVYSGSNSNDGSAIYANQPIRFGYATSKAAAGYADLMYLSTSGNLGLGVTPSAWDSAKAIQVNARSSLFGFSNDTHVAYNSYYSSTGYKYIASDFASDYMQTSGQHRWFTAPSGTAGNAITFTQAMTLDASGRLMNGTTSPVGQLTVFNAGSNDGAENAVAIMRFGTTYGSALFHNYNSTFGLEALNLTVSDGTGTPANNTLTKYRILNNGTHLWYGATTATEHARITSGGDFGLGVTSPGAKLDVYSSSTTAGTPIAFFGKELNSNATSNVLVKFLINFGGTGSGQINADGASAAAFGTYSDARLKENIVSLPPQLANICALRPVEFDYKDGSGHQIGFVAQEMQTVYPDVVGSGNDEMLTVTGWSKTEARLVKAIQELKAEVDSLKAQLKGA